MQYLCHGKKFSEDEVWPERYGKHETARRIKIQVGEFYLRTSSDQEPSERLRAHIKRIDYGSYKT